RRHELLCRSGRTVGVAFAGDAYENINVRTGHRSPGRSALRSPIRRHQNPTKKPVSTQSVAWTAREVAANCAARSGGTLLLGASAPRCGAPQMGGATKSATARIRSAMLSERKKSQAAADVDMAVSAHHSWRPARSAAAMPGTSGGRATAGATPVDTK